MVFQAYPWTGVISFINETAIGCNRYPVWAHLCRSPHPCQDEAIIDALQQADLIDPATACRWQRTTTWRLENKLARALGSNPTQASNKAWPE